MQEIIHLGREGANPASVTTIILLCVEYRAVASANRDFRPPCHQSLVGRIDRLRTRQDELIQFVGTYRAFNNEQVGIACRDVCLIFFNTARWHEHADHQA